MGFIWRLLRDALEFTKLHEEIYRGSLHEAYQYFTVNPPRGEFTLVVAGNTGKAEPWSKEGLTIALKEHLARGEHTRKIAEEISKPSGWSRSEIYQFILKIKGK